MNSRDFLVKSLSLIEFSSYNILINRIKSKNLVGKSFVSDILGSQKVEQSEKLLTKYTFLSILNIFFSLTNFSILILFVIKNRNHVKWASRGSR